jgi:hypothetical protein
MSNIFFEINVISCQWDIIEFSMVDISQTKHMPLDDNTRSER